MLFDHDALFYADAVREGRMTVTQIVRAAVSNIEADNETLNAVVHLQKDQALETAGQYDRQLQHLSVDQRRRLPIFYGVPILLKDLSMDQAGQTSTSGSKLLLAFKADQTDNFVQKILDLGFVVVGRTNVPEFGFKNMSDSETTGPVNTPFDLSRNPGGSSGGSAAALKAGMVPIAAATDGGGSIRIPASFSGLVGLKPTRGRTPVGPSSFRGWQGASIAFGLTKSVRDTRALLLGMQVEQKDAPFTTSKILSADIDAWGRKPIRIAYSLKSPIGTPVSEEAKIAVLNTAEQLKLLGYEVVENQPEVDGIKAMQTYYIVNGVETASMMQGIEAGLGRDLTVDDMEVMSWGLYRYGLNIKATEYSQVLDYWDQLTYQTEAFFKDHDVLLMPATNGPAPKQTAFARSADLLDKLAHMDDYSTEEQAGFIWEMFTESLAYTPFTQQQNLTGQPAISLPLHLTQEGLPLGVQFSASKGEEALLLHLASRLEDQGLLHNQITPVKEP